MMTKSTLSGSKQRDYYYIKKVIIENIRCFETIELDLASENHTRKMAVIFGDNGEGKSTFLRCLALGLCDRDSVAALMKERTGDWIRKGSIGPGKIKITIKNSETEHTITTKIKKSASGFETVSQGYGKIKDSEKFPWNDIFLCAYGACRGSEGEAGTYTMYSPVESTLSLFNYDAALNHPELLIRRRTKKEQDEICECLGDVLLLDKKKGEKVKLNKLGLTISGKWGEGIYLGALSDGYEATLTWVMDLFGWAWLAGQGNKKTDLGGIVIVDELDQHLHPKWQQKILFALHDRFPNIQFIVSTHSPLLAMGTTQLEENSYQVAQLKRPENKPVEIKTDFPEFKGWNASQILGSQLFDWVMLDTSERQKLYRTAALLEKKGQERTPEENEDLLNIKRDLKRTFLLNVSSDIESKIGNEFYQDIRDLTVSLEKELWGDDD